MGPGWGLIRLWVSIYFPCYGIFTVLIPPYGWLDCVWWRNILCFVTLFCGLCFFYFVYCFLRYVVCYGVFFYAL